MSFRRLIIPAIVISIVSIGVTAVWSASPPPIITYQGKVLVSGSPASTTLPMQFTIYNAISGGTALYTASGSTSSPTNITITTTQGLFTVYLGDNGTNPINPEIFKDNDTLYLQVVINGEALNPRKRLATTPYALNSKYLDGYIATSTPTTTNYIPVSDASGNFSFNNITSTNIVVQKNNTSGVGSTISVLSANGNAAAGLFNYHVDSSTYHGILTLYSSVDDPSTPSLFFNAAPGGSSWIKSKLSIGTTTIPWYDLDVAGDINFTGNLYQDGILFSGGSLPSGILGQFLVHDGSDWLSTNTFTTTTFVTDILPSTHLTYTLGNSSSRFSEGWFENVYIGSSTWKLGQDENNLLTFTDINSSASSALAINNQGFVGFGISPGSAKVTIRDEGGVVTTSKPTNVRLIGFQCGGGMPSSLQWDAKVFAFKNTKSGPVYSEASISLNSPKNAESVCGPGVDAVPNWAWDAPVDDSVDGYILNLYLGAPGYNNWNIYAITQKTTFEAQNGDYEGDNLKFTSGGPFDATPTSGFGSLRNRDSLQLSYDENSYAAIKAYDTGALSIKTNGTNKGLYVSETGNLKIGSSFESSAKFFVENSQTGLEVIIQNSLSPNIQTLKVIDNTLYAIDRDPATGNKTFVIYDVTNKFSPSLISTIPPPVDSEFVENLEVSGNYAYIQERDAVGDVFIGIYNISNPASVSRVSQISNSNSFVDYIKEHNGRLYFSTIDITANPILRIYDISSGFPAGHIIDINLNSNAYKFIINNDFLYYYWGSNVEIIDLNNISNTSNRGVPEPINDIYILGDYLYVANGWRITIFEKVNSDPLNLDNVGDVWSENGNFTKIKVINSYLYGSINNGSLAGVEVKNAINGNYIDFYRSSQSNIGTFDVDNNNYVFTIEGIALSSILKLNEIENPAYAAIFNGGSVGIGTTNPEQTLSVVGNIGVTKGLYFGRNSRSSDTNYSLYSENGNLYWNGSSLSLPSGSVFGQTLYYDGWNWQASDNLINTGWNIGIGNSSPSYRLDVGGDINFTGTLYQNGTPFSSGSSLPSGLPGDILVNDSFGNWTNSSYIFVSSSSGFVGLNNSNPSDRLSIYGGVDITGMLKFGGTGGTANQVLMINPVTSLPYWTSTSSLGISGASLPSGMTGQTLFYGSSGWEATSRITINNTTNSISMLNAFSNTAGNWSFAAGMQNRASGGYSFVGGGSSNIASGESSFIGGGFVNEAGGLRSAIIGGYDNEAFGRDSIILGGWYNTTTNYFTAIIGGQANIASGMGATIVGGYGSIASGVNSVILGGQDNLVSGDYSIVLGGVNNTSTGISSYAMGSGMGVFGDSSFGINLSTTTAQTLSQNNTFAILGGNVGIGDNAPGRLLSVQGSSLFDNQLLSNQEGGIYFGRTRVSENMWNSDMETIWNVTSSKAFDAFWRDLAISSDGKYQSLAKGNDYIYISSDYGNTWVISTSSDQRSWVGISISSNGKYQTAVAGDGDGDVYISSDYGATWSDKTTDNSGNWSSVSISADGKYQTAVAMNGFVHTSSDYGNTWKRNNTIYAGTNPAVGISSDGKYQTVIYSGYIYISSNYGNTFVQKFSSYYGEFRSVALSSDGKYQTVVSGNHWNADANYIYISSDYGNTWTTSTSAGARKWQDVAISANGKYQTAISISNGYDADQGSIYFSSDYGNTWVNKNFINNTWRSIVVSAEGNFQAVISNYSPIYTSYVDISYGGNVNISGNYFINGSPIIPSGISGQMLVNQGGASWQATSALFVASNGVSVRDQLIFDQGGGLYFGKNKISENNWAIDVGSVWSDYHIKADSQKINWASISISSDGKYQIAGNSSNNLLYSSSDYGYSWTTTTPGWGYTKTAMSSDGKYQTITGLGNQIRVSSDYGKTWSIGRGAFAGCHSSISMSSDGKYQLATCNGSIVRSFNYGISGSWSESNAFGSTDSAVSSDGKYQILAEMDGPIRVSSDYGITWTTSTSAGENAWSAVSISANGKYQTAVVGSATDWDYIYISSDYGNTWSAKGKSTRWSDVAMSSDGKYQSAVELQSGYIFSSIDHGNTWATNTATGIKNWTSIAISSDGQFQSATALNDYIYISGSNLYNFNKIGIGTKAQNEKLSVKGSILQSAEKIKFLGTFSPSAKVTDIKVSGNYAYASIFNDSPFYDGVHRIDISSITNPRTVSIFLESGVTKVDVKNNHVHVLDENGFYITDFSDFSPALYNSLGSLSSNFNQPMDLVVSGKYAYITGLNGDDLSIVDISDPRKPIVKSIYQTGASAGYINGVYVSGRYAYLTSFNTSTGFQIVDISNPVAPVYKSSVTSTNLKPIEVQVSGNYAYILSSFDENKLQIIDISRVDQPTTTGILSLPGNPYDIKVSGKYAYVTVVNGVPGLYVIDISSPENPVLADSYLLDSALGVDVSGNNIFVGTVTTGLKIFEFSKTEVTSLLAQTAEIGDLKIINDLNVSGNGDFRGLNIGFDGLFSKGSISAFSTTTANYFGGSVGIGTSTPLAKLSLDGDGAILAQGSFGSGWDGGALGAGTRLMWIPGKAAFRAGYSGGTEWNSSTIGNYSAVVGGAFNTASGSYSFVGGGSSLSALANYSAVVGGTGNVANTQGSFIGGGQSNNTWGVNSFIAGGFNNTAGGIESFVGGGNNNYAQGNYSFVGGGSGKTVSGISSVAFGTNLTVSGNYSFGINVSTTASTISQANTIALMGGNVGVGTTSPDYKLNIFGTAGQNLFKVATSGNQGIFTINSSGNVGIGTTSPLSKLHINDGGLLVTGSTGATPVSGAGTRLMWIPEKKAFRAGAVSGDKWDSANIGQESVAFGDNKVSGQYSFVSGDGNSVSGIASFIAGGNYNNIYTDDSFIGGGWSNIASGTYSFVGAGRDNDALGEYSAVIGGQYNKASDYYSFVGGGNYNTASGVRSAVVGGQLNTSTGPLAFIGGGQENSISGQLSSINGGLANTISSDYSFIGGGQNNDVTGLGSFIAGGIGNTIGGDNSFIGAGDGSQANGLGSVAFGKSMIVNGDRSFGISLGIVGDTIDENNVMAIVGGSVGIGTVSPVDTLEVCAGAICGAVSSSTGDWYVSSDASLKKNITDFTGGLEKVLSLRPVGYEFNNEADASGTSHIGFIAQELEKIIPQLVKTNPNNGLKSLAYANLTPILVQAIQEQQAQIDALKNTSTTLTVQNDGSQIVYTVDMGQDMLGRPLLNVASIIGANNKWEIDTNGTLITKVTTASGIEKKLYGMSSENAEITLSGTSTLENGEARIIFTSDIQEIIDETQPIKVIFSLTSPCNKNIYVSEKSKEGFVLKMVDGNESGITFDWMVLVKRKFSDPFVEEIILENGSEESTTEILDETETNTSTEEIVESINEEIPLEEEMVEPVVEETLVDESETETESPETSLENPVE